jgi:putative tricarboxylic transport membrane protein
MWIGNAILLILNLPLIGIWVELLHVPYRLLFPAILLFCAVGVFSVNNASFDIVLATLLGGFGYLLHKLGCEAAPLLLGFIIGPMLEENLRRALLISRGDPAIFIERPISAALLGCCLALLLLMVLPAFRRTREEALVGD